MGKKESLKIESALLTNELIEERIEDIKYDEDLLNTYIDKRFGVEGDWVKEKVLLSQPAQKRQMTMSKNKVVNIII